jgi:hypothetical protein
MSEKIPRSEFLKSFERLWKKGPFVQYQSPEAWINPKSFRLPF